MGTSLQVKGLKALIKNLADEVHAPPVRGHVLFVNKTKPALSEWGDTFDYWVQGECDVWVRTVEIEWSKGQDLVRSGPRLRAPLSGDRALSGVGEASFRLLAAGLKGRVFDASHIFSRQVHGRGLRCDYKAWN